MPVVPLEIKKRNTLRGLFASIPDLKPFEQVIDILFSEFYSKDAIIIIDSQINSSHLAQTPRNMLSRNFELYIGIREREDPLDVLWSIFHEYGHLLQDRPTDQELIEGTYAKYLRELDAWGLGETKFLEFDILKPYLNNFKTYRTMCQNSYVVDR
ncbi:hypothetical protein [Pedobacter frigoris]|uniref:IrrE N-terminal-like domain-containing protein n=1 Tax=Pedobacter frigoris TaxID=2571272 RepID=A0A4U1CBZ6_9SPHI|nr:hypothetical protein [Pedobacter frigoris]TKC04245.1 hypothetical protein FA047_16750 [Pedobacter frigoris]